MTTLSWSRTSWLAIALVTLLSGAARAVEADIYCMTGTSSTGAPIFVPAGSVSPAVPCPVLISPAPRTLVTLDVKTVTTGGAAVVAIAPGHRTAGGFLKNPENATINLCINEIGTASGTTSSGDTTCILPGQSYGVSPATTGVSVVSSDSSHPFSGYGLQ